MRGFQSLFVFLFLLWGCASVDSALKRTVTIFVGVDSTLQPAVKVFAVMNDGTRSLVGVTGEGGGLSIDVERLRSHGAVCLLFEKEGFFTSAIWLSGYEFSDPDYIGLTKFILP